MFAVCETVICYMIAAIEQFFNTTTLLQPPPELFEFLAKKLLCFSFIFWGDIQLLALPYYSVELPNLDDCILFQSFPGTEGNFT